jgi:hypothetical protein
MGSMFKSKGPLKSLVQKAMYAKQGRLSQSYTGIDPRQRQGSNTGQTSRPGMSRPRGRGGVPNPRSRMTPGPGPIKSPLSL